MRLQIPSWIDSFLSMDTAAFTFGMASRRAGGSMWGWQLAAANVFLKVLWIGAAGLWKTGGLPHAQQMGSMARCKQAGLSVLLALSALVGTSGDASAFVCSGGWPVRRDDSAEAFETLQCWLSEWQHNCSMPVSQGLPVGSGIGAAVESAVRWMLFAVEQNKVYRPTNTPWFVDGSSTNCSIPSIHAFDCYFEPVSSCGYSQNRSTQSRCPSLATNLTAQLGAGSVDVCRIATALQKPLQWVHGSMYHYVTRRGAGTVRSRVNARVDSVLARRAHGEAVIAIHVRGGRPDSKRVPCNVSYYIEAADKIAAELLLIEKKTVKWVFLCSDYQEEVLGSAASLSERFPRQWTYVLLPHLSMAPLINESHTRLREIQHLMEAKSLDRYGKPSREDIVVEYIADIEILAGANAF